MRVPKTRRFFQCLQYVTPGHGVVIHAQLAGETEMNIGRIGGIEQEQLFIRTNRLPGRAELFAGTTQEAVRLRQERIHSEVAFGVLRDRFPVLRGFGEFHEAEISVERVGFLRCPFL